MYIYFFSKLNIIKIKNLETSSKSNISKSNISKSHFRGEQKTFEQKTLQQTCFRCFHDAFFSSSRCFLLHENGSSRAVRFSMLLFSSTLCFFSTFFSFPFLIYNQISIQCDSSDCWVFSFSMCIVCCVKRIRCE